MKPKSLVASVALVFAVPFAHSATVAEVESNNTHTTAQFITPFAFTSEFVVDIESSTTYKHATIAATGDGSVDWFVFNHDGGRMILDIDGGMPSNDLWLSVWDLGGNLIATNDDSGLTDPGSVHPFDSFIDLASTASGLYYVGVSLFPSTPAANFDIGGAGFNNNGYQLHISSGAAIPEPSSALLVGLASLSLLGRRRR